MALETATFINDLVSANPAGSDGKSQGDDHIRLIKAALQATFPLAIGARKLRDDTASAADTLAFTLYRHRTGVANDALGSYRITGDNGSGTEKTALMLQSKWITPTAAAEDTDAILSVLVGGTLTNVMQLNNFRPVTAQLVGSDGATWTKQRGCKKVVLEGIGGGGGAGGCAGALGNWASTGGGGSGFYGFSVPIDVAFVTSAVVTIGAGGAGGAAGNNAGGTGGTTQITLNATTYTWPGGDGSPGSGTSVSDHLNTSPGTFAALGSNVMGSSNQGNFGWLSASDTDAYGGAGAPSPFGIGGDRVVITTTGGANGNNAAALTGAGGGGCCSGNQAINRSGGAGGSGFLRIWEYY